MDLSSMGQFLSQLRKEQGWTQEQLGEKLGVTNKTVSRWETGSYMPPVEMLSELSELYGITINELLSGKRAEESNYQDIAEENIKEVLHASFTLKEKIAFYKNKWKKDHRSSLIVMILCFSFLYFLGWSDDSQLLNMVTTLGIFLFSVMRYNVMMIYVERRAFDPVYGEEDDCITHTKEELLWTRVRITGLIILGISIWVCADLADNFLYSLIPELNDGITIRGFWAKLFFGSDGIQWNRENYYFGMMNAVKVVTVAAIGNIMVYCIERTKRLR